MPADPLSQLVVHLRRDKGRAGPPPRWSAEHAPDGDLDAAVARLWSTCPDAHLLMAIGARLADGPAVVRAGLACSSLARHFVPPDDERPERIAELAGRWATGEAEAADALKAHCVPLGGLAAAPTFAADDEHRRAAAHCALCAFRHLACVPFERDGPPAAIVSSVGEAYGWSALPRSPPEPLRTSAADVWRRVCAHVKAHLAGPVRAELAVVPTFDDVRAAARR
jgi:hypothetical protein